VRRWLWSIRWRIYHALSRPYTPGGHRFVRSVCLCGHETKNDPKRCTVWR